MIVPMLFVLLFPSPDPGIRAAPPGWSADVREVSIMSTADGSEQPALYWAPEGGEGPAPLLVGLHTWSSDEKQPEGAAYLAACRARGWVFIHPRFQGPNRNPEACGSAVALQDIADAVEWARAHAPVDANRIYLIGASGGGHAALLAAARWPGIWAAVSAWVPPTDLAAWHGQAKARGLRYAKDLEDVCGGAPGTSAEVDRQYRERSPLFSLDMAKGIPIEVGAGIRDGHDGSVPVSHALRAYNALASANGFAGLLIAEETIAEIVRAARIPEGLDPGVRDDPTFAKRVLLRRLAGPVRLTIFDGGHECDVDAAIQWLAGHSKPYRGKIVQLPRFAPGGGWTIEKTLGEGEMTWQEDPGPADPHHVARFHSSAERGMSATLASPYFAIEPGRRYVLRVPVRTEDLVPINARMTAGAYLYFRDTRKWPGAFLPVSGIGPKTSEWRDLSIGIVAPTTAREAQLHLVFAGYDGWEGGHPRVTGRARGTVCFGEPRLTATDRSLPLRSTIEVPDARIAAGLDVAAEALHNASLSGTFTVSDGYTISGNIVPDLSFCLFGVRRLAHRGYVRLLQDHWIAIGRTMDEAGCIRSQRVMAQVLFPLGVDEIFSFAGDRAFLDAMLPLAERSLGYLAGKADPEGLVRLVEYGKWSIGEGADWVDWYKTRMEGKTFLFHVWYVRALRRIAALQEERGNPDGAARNRERAAKIAEALRRRYWREDHFITNIDFGGKVADEIWLDDQLWAIAFGIAGEAERRAIFARIDGDAERFEGTPTRWAAFDGPAHGHLSWFGRLGTGDILARYRTGGEARGLALLRRISETFARDGNVYEAYDMAGEPAQGTAGWGNYSEHAGGYVWAVAEGPFGVSFESDAEALAEIRPRFPREWPSARMKFFLRGTHVELRYRAQGGVKSVSLSGTGKPVAIRVLAPDGSAPRVIRVGDGAEALIEWTEPAGLRIGSAGETRRVEILAGDEVLLASPAEGLWSIACDWRDDWPAEWRHADPKTVEQTGEWTILCGEIHAPGGTWELRDAYRQAGRAVRCVRRFTWRGSEPAGRCTLSVRFVAKAEGAQVLVPGIIYHGNPSGARSGRVPVFVGRVGEEAIFEEHRYPVPFASLEWAAGDGWRGAALHTVPSPVPFANRKDQWWSLGVAAREGETEILLLSGPCASNGKRSVIKAVQPGFVPYGETYLNVPPGAVIEKTFLLEAYPVAAEGAGFRRPLRTAIDLSAPFSVDGLPSFPEIIRAKYRFAKTRWTEADGAAGFRKYPDRPFLVMGWCGQAAAPGYALQVLADGLGDPGAAKIVQASLDTLSGAAFYEGGFRTWYDYQAKAWSHHEPLSQGQAMLSFARAIRVGRVRGFETARWESFLRKACEFHATRILTDGWKPLSTAEAFLIAPLCEASKLFGETEYLRAAVRAGEVYAARHIAMREPYWGGTLDASCEDKEGAYAAFQGFLALAEATGHSRTLAWAEHACDVVLTYLVVWDIDLPAGRLRDHGFKTRGWTVVSPQNQHIDAYGVLMAPDVFRLGTILGREDLRRIGILMFRSCGQIIDPYGSQGEQPQHTNYAQRGKVADVEVLRGGYQEEWTVFWITAHFLSAAARFAELGVDVWAE